MRLVKAKQCKTNPPSSICGAQLTLECFLRVVFFIRKGKVYENTRTCTGVELGETVFYL